MWIINDKMIQTLMFVSSVMSCLIPEASVTTRIAAGLQDDRTKRVLFWKWKLILPPSGVYVCILTGTHNQLASGMKQDKISALGLCIERASKISTAPLHRSHGNLIYLHRGVHGDHASTSPLTICWRSMEPAAGRHACMSCLVGQFPLVLYVLGFLKAY